MRKISSGMTTFYKKIFPAFWFGFLILFVVGIFDSPLLAQGRWPVLLVPFIMAIVGYVLMKHLFWDLVDEVHDNGDALIVKNGDIEERIPFSNIMNVSASLLVNPQRVTLRLVNAGRLGQEVSFSPFVPFGFHRFKRNEIVDDLIVRVDKARVKHLMMA